MKDIRLIATDLDGTLLDRESRVRPYTLRTLRDCIDRGITVMIVSGRCHEDARIPAVETGLPLMVASCNGARIDRTAYGPTVYERTMTDAEAHVCYDILSTCLGNVNSYIKGRNFCKRVPEKRRAGDTRLVGLPDMRAEWIYDDMPRMESEGLTGVYKFEIYNDDPALLADYADRLTAAGMAVTSSNPIDIEIQPADSTKGAAVRHMAEMLGISRDQVMAFGDNTNDSSMLEEAGIGVAMANAVPELRAIADMIAPPNAFEGEARVIRSVIFGEKDIWPFIM